MLLNSLVENLVFFWWGGTKDDVFFQEEVKKAYRSLALSAHPDKLVSAEPEEVKKVGSARSLRFIS